MGSASTRLGAGPNDRRRTIRRLCAAIALAALAVSAACGAAPGTRTTTTTTALQGAKLRSPSYTVPSTVPSTTAPATTAPATTAPPTTAPPTTAPPGATSWQMSGEPSKVAGCQVLDRASVFHSTVTGLPVHPRSAEWIDHLGATSPLGVAISSFVWQGSRPGIPINVVDGNVTRAAPIVYGASWPDSPLTVPMPWPVHVEGDPTPAWDSHVVVVDSAACTSYELISYNLGTYILTGIHWALDGVTWRLGPAGGTTPQRGTTVSAAPIVGTMIRLAEVQAGRIDHLIAACTNKASSAKVWPAMGSDGKDTTSSALPMGTRLRLRAGIDPASFDGQARTIVQAMRTHGLMISDSCGGPLGFGAENVATGWDASIPQLTGLKVGDFEVVDTTPMMISPTSWQVR